jgi:hypothetical protein
VEGGQCADFNGYNLHDYKEFLDCGFNRQPALTRTWNQCLERFPARASHVILEMPETL